MHSEQVQFKPINITVKLGYRPSKHNYKCSQVSIDKSKLPSPGSYRDQILSPNYDVILIQNGQHEADEVAAGADQEDKSGCLEFTSLHRLNTHMD